MIQTVEELPKYPRCVNCHRLVKSKVTYMHNRPYGPVCIQIKRGEIKREPRYKESTGQHHFDMGSNGS